MSSKIETINAFSLHENDKGSSPVQIALLTSRIKHLTEHFKANRKDKHSTRGLHRIIQQRTKLLSYYKKTSPSAYYELISKLSIRDKKN